MNFKKPSLLENVPIVATDSSQDVETWKPAQTQRQPTVEFCESLKAHIAKLQTELKDMRWHWERVAAHVIPGQQDTVETVLAMLKERDELRTRVVELERYRDDFLKASRDRERRGERIAELEEDLRFYRNEWESACERYRYGQEEIAELTAEIECLAGDGDSVLTNLEKSYEKRIAELETEIEAMDAALLKRTEEYGTVLEENMRLRAELGDET